MSGILEEMGFTNSAKEEADVLIINTCAIRENAEDRFYGTVGGLKALKQKKKEYIIICLIWKKKYLLQMLNN